MTDLITVRVTTVFGLALILIFPLAVSTEEEILGYYRSNVDMDIPMRSGPTTSGVRLPVEVPAGSVITVIGRDQDSSGNLWLRLADQSGLSCPESGCWIAATYQGTSRFDEIDGPRTDIMLNPYQDYLDPGQAVHRCDLENDVFQLLGLSGVRMKSREELRRWMWCFTNPQGQGSLNDADGASGWNLYRQVEDQIEIVSEVTGLPYAFLACKWWRESRFDADAVSGSDARGIGQFKFDTMLDLERLMSRTSNRAHEELRLQALLENAPQPGDPRFAQWERDISYMRRILQSRARRDLLYTDWREMTTALGATNDPYQVYPQQLDPQGFCAGEETYPVQLEVCLTEDGTAVSQRTIIRDGRFEARSPAPNCPRIEYREHPNFSETRCDNWEYNNPLWSMAASALYLKDLTMELDHRYQYDWSEPALFRQENSIYTNDQRALEAMVQGSGGDMDVITRSLNDMPRDFLLLVAAAYNAGPGGVSEMMARGVNLDQWLAYLGETGRLAETRAHMQSIRDCMEPGQFTLDSQLGENPNGRCDEPGWEQ